MQLQYTVIGNIGMPRITSRHTSTIFVLPFLAVWLACLVAAPAPFSQQTGQLRHQLYSWIVQYHPTCWGYVTRFQTAAD